MPVALITGITGQDGSYLAEFLLGQGYVVHGVVRRASYKNTNRIEHIISRLNLHDGDITDCAFIDRLISVVEPDEVYNLAAQSHVAVSFDVPSTSTNIDAMGFLNVLEACRDRSIRIYQASTSELFGGIGDIYNESSLMVPRSPYAAAKLYAHNMARIYRESYGMFICCGILFNHTSPRRGGDFVEKKIIDAAVLIKNGSLVPLKLGNLYSTRDIGHAKDYVVAMWLMLQYMKPDDYVVATGKSISIKNLVDKIFNILGMKLEWVGEGLNEEAYYMGRCVVEVTEKLYRPLEVNNLLGDSTKIRNLTQWHPSCSLDDILRDIISSQLTSMQFHQPENMHTT